jgi:hypothetical protein
MNAATARAGTIVTTAVAAGVTDTVKAADTAITTNNNKGASRLLSFL